LNLGLGKMRKLLFFCLVGQLDGGQLNPKRKEGQTLKDENQFKQLYNLDLSPSQQQSPPG